MFTMQELITEWFYDYERNLIKSSSAACYYAHIYNYIVPCLGEYAVEELSEFVLQNYFMELYKNGRKKCEGGLSSKTVQDNYMILNNFFKYLKKRGIIKENICSDIRLPKDYNHNVRVLSREEQRAIEREVRKSTYENSFGIIICLYTGIRIGELCGLRLKDIDLQQGILRVRGTVQRIRNIGDEQAATSIVYGPPKSIASIRDIPLAEPIYELMKIKIEDRLEKESGNHALLLTKSGKYVEPRVYQKHFQSIVKKANIPEANFHCLRHTFATRALETGVDYKTLSELLGHSSPTITLKIYAHSLLEEKKKAVHLVGQLYS